ncbi:hypothetical protein BN903_16 [Halorubrum sp. AJ67]|nr:hypothetical protein BN903_16 [Halorubrum sp. AJ67]
MYGSRGVRRVGTPPSDASERLPEVRDGSEVNTYIRQPSVSTSDEVL